MPCILAHSPDIVLLPLGLVMLPLAFACCILPPQLALFLAPVPAWRRFLGILSAILFNIAGLFLLFMYAQAVCFVYGHGRVLLSTMALMLLFWVLLELFLFRRRWQHCQRVKAARHAESNR